LSLHGLIQKVVTIAQEYNRTRTDISTFLDHLLGNAIYDIGCDLGCGDAKAFGQMVKKHVKFVIGFDLGVASLQVASKIYDRTILDDFQHFDKHLECYDAVFMFDSLEHLTKEEGDELLRRIMVTAKLIVVATPSKFAPSGPQIFGINYPGVGHKSVWTPNEFLKLGFRCWIVEQTEAFWKNLYGDQLLAIWTSTQQASLPVSQQ
jgi:hypothetical protein